MIKFIKGIEKSPFDARDYRVEFIQAVGDEDNLPTTLDLRGGMFRVKDQGNQGTCSAFAATQMKEWEEKKEISLNEILAPQFVYNLRSNYPEEGMIPRDTMDILYKTGIVEDKLYPYGKSFVPTTITSELKKHAAIYKIKGYAAVSTIIGLKKALYTNGVCYIGVPVYNTGARMWKQAPGQSFLGGHAMAIVGWNTEGFIIRNSWGNYWNDDGHTIFPYTDWGLQWEVWTAIDDITPIPIPKLSLWKRFIKWIKSLFA
jgi:C1A family cysteine protease